MIVKSVLLARGGSKGIPRKNIVDLNGFPLIHYTALASLKSQVSETWVSTDDDEIEKICIDLGCKVLKRPANISNDKSSSEEALLHFSENVDFDVLVFIQPTSPMLTSIDINCGLEMISDYDSVFSAFKQHWIPSWNSKIEPDGWIKEKRPRRQDVEEKYVENGAFYITKKQSLQSSKLRYSGKIGIYEMPFSRSFQIDTFEDLHFVSKIMS